MSSAADRLKAKNERIRAAQADGNPAAAASTRVRTTPVRVTVDLPPAEHAGLVQWCTQAAAELGMPRVSNQSVLRALVARLTRDPQLAAAIREQLPQ